MIPSEAKTNFACSPIFAGRRWLGLALLAGASFAVSSSLGAQEPAEPETIIVQAEREAPLSDQEIAQVAEDYATSLTVVSSYEALARFEPGVFCPRAVGMSEAVNSAIETRMRRVAQAVGVEVAPRHECETSTIVFLVEDKDRFLEEFEIAHPKYFLSLKDKHWKIPQESGPAIAWQLTQLIEENGDPIKRWANGVQVVSSFSGGSRLLAMTHTAIAMSVLIVEREALSGFTVDQFADYALMRTLTSGKPGELKSDNAKTILTLLDTPMGGRAHQSVTEWDFAYLTELYSGDPRLYGERKGSMLRRALREAAVDGN